jgi:hypothetical protein
LVFTMEAMALAWVAWRDGFAFRPRTDMFGVVGALFVIYALLIYPLLGYAAGHRYPSTPTFGLPCPTTIFTFGLLLWSERRVPLRVVLVPATWSLLGMTAALSFGVPEDFGLPVAGVLGTLLIVLRNRRLASGTSSSIPAFA